MATLRELALRARELEERGIVLQWMENQLRTLITGNTELRIEDKPVQASTVTQVMADIKDLLELNARELSSILDQDLSPAKPGKEKASDDIPTFEKPRRPQQGRKG